VNKRATNFLFLGTAMKAIHIPNDNK
jgi:hypothetical protein